MGGVEEMEEGALEAACWRGVSDGVEIQHTVHIHTHTYTDTTHTHHMHTHTHIIPAMTYSEQTYKCVHPELLERERETSLM